MTNVVMCPSHLVRMWKREIEDRSPNSEAIIVKDFNHLISLIPKIKGDKMMHCWLIISKETAKLGYDMRPAAVWRPNKKIPGTDIRGVFCCPECGKPLYYNTIQGSGRNRCKIPHYLRYTDFRKGSLDKNNLVCTNTKIKWDMVSHKSTGCPCNTKLWVPSTKDNHGWVKLGKQGWFLRQHLPIIEQSISNEASPTTEDLKLLAAIQDELEGNGVPQRSPRKYPIAKFIRRYLKGYIDYCILDELHGYKSKDSLQGEAAGDLIFTAKKTIGLTGTLLNGFSSGIYYLLYRMFPRQMVREGYEYRNPNDFVKNYGVSRKKQWFELNRGRIGDQIKAEQPKEMPGISPVVFTKFLLENAAFISLDDISDALPNYEEIPVPLDMSDQLRLSYETLSRNAAEILRRNSKPHKIISSIVSLLSVYPDQPYKQPDIYDPETGELLLTVPELQITNEVKENALISLIQEKIQQGEKVLVYYYWTSRTNIAKRLPELLNQYDITYATLDTSVKPEEREAWIEHKIEEGIQVLLCNPTLVETGLTLLDFTTIIWYQLGYNLYTMRQASRRSLRINQTHDVQVYFFYYKGTVQEQALSLMATKLQASMTIEGKFSEEGLQAMSDNEDIMTQLAGSITNNIQETLDIQVFEKHKVKRQREQQETKQVKKKKHKIEIPDIFN